MYTVVPCLLALLLLVVACTTPGAPSTPALRTASPGAPTVSASPRSLSRILAVRPPVTTRSAQNLYAINSDGTDLLQITDNQQVDVQFWYSAWSPDGRRILFVAKQPGRDDEIYTMNGDGTGQRALTQNESDDYQPAWSPSGEQIAFVSEAADGTTRVFLMRDDGSDLHRLTLTDEYCESSPTWSPTGAQLVYIADDCTMADAEVHLRIVDIDGTHERRLTPSRADIRELTNPRWAPDGQWIAYDVVLTEGGHWFNFIAPDGSRVLEARATDAQWFASPVWSPDGRRVVFALGLGSPRLYSGLGVMDVPELNWRALDVDGDSNDRCWLPGSLQIAFYSHEDNALWVVDADGANPHRIARDLGLADCAAGHLSP